jgi:hypothetical protein
MEMILHFPQIYGWQDTTLNWMDRMLVSLISRINGNKAIVERWECVAGKCLEYEGVIWLLSLVMRWLIECDWLPKMGASKEMCQCLSGWNVFFKLFDFFKNFNFFLSIWYVKK